MAPGLADGVLPSFALVRAEKYQDAIRYVESLLAAEHALDRKDANVLRMFNNHLICYLKVGAYAQGAAFADSIQDVAPLNPNIFHNAACHYCFTGQLQKAVAQVQLARRYGGPEFIRKLEHDEDLRPIFEHPGFQQAIQPRQRLAPARRVLIPPEGSRHPLFARISPNDGIGVYVTYREPGDEDLHGRLSEAVQRWRETHGWIQSGAAANDVPMSVAQFPNGIEVHFLGATTPRPAIDSLLRVLEEHGDIIEIMILRRELDRATNAPGRVIFDALPPFRTAKTEDEFWRRAFDSGSDPLPPEDPAGMCSFVELESGETLSELRPAVLQVDGLRIGYGLANIDYLPADEASHHASQALQRHLATYFCGKVPVVWNRRKEEDGPLDRIVKTGRRGFAFALQRDDLLAFYAARFRYREHELFFALRDTVQELGLCHVIHWDRGSVYIVNLWEESPRESRPA